MLHGCVGVIRGITRVQLLCYPHAFDEEKTALEERASTPHYSEGGHSKFQSGLVGIQKPDGVVQQALPNDPEKI